jgi:nucleotide-binding universal stress UspA family protein
MQMTFRTVLVHAALDPDSAARCAAAAAIAHRFGARLAGIGAQAFWPYAPPAEVKGKMRPLLQQAEAELEQARANFEALGLEAPGGVTWRMAVEHPHDAIASFARLGDLVIAGRPRGAADPTLFASVDDLVMQCGIPVLLIPDWPQPPPMRTVVVAWKNTREARRAVGDALPFLHGAERVIVAGVAERDDHAALTAEITDVRERLAAHGITAEMALREGEATTALPAIADEAAADLIVAGAYGHSRLREWVLGGLTRTLIADTGRCVFFSR